MRNWLKTVLFLSAFSPALLSLALVRSQLGAPIREVGQLLVIGVLGSLLPVLIIAAAGRQGESMPIRIKKLEANDFALFGFVASYFLPIVLKASELDLYVILLVLAGAGALLWGVNQIPAHPVLHVLRYRFYKAESESGMVYVLVARRPIIDPKSVTQVKQLSTSFLIECPRT